jgi:hypothetical protein
MVSTFLFGFFFAIFLMSMIQCIFILNSMKKTCNRMIKNINGMKRTLKNY